MGQALANLQAALLVLESQSAATVTAIQNLQAISNNDPAPIQAAADRINAVVSSLKAATPTS